jgi:hypothetical protein
MEGRVKDKTPLKKGRVSSKQVFLLSSGIHCHLCRWHYHQTLEVIRKAGHCRNGAENPMNLKGRFIF